MISALIHRAGGFKPPAAFVRCVTSSMLLGLALCGNAFAFDAFGEVALKKRGDTRGRLVTDTLMSDRGKIKAEAFEPVATDTTSGVSVTWMLPKGSKCPLVETPTAREESLARAASIFRELLPDHRPSIDVRVYVVPMFVRLRHKARFDLAAERVALEFGMSAPCASRTVTADMLSVLVHELTHISYWSDRIPNRLSNEAIAYTVHSTAWWRIRDQPPDFRRFPHKDNSVPPGRTWSRLFREERSVSTRAGRVAQYALASLPAEPGKEVASADTVTAYVRCLLDERPDFKKGNPAAVFAETRGAHCSPGRARQEPLAGS